MPSVEQPNRREETRLKVPPMYTQVIARRGTEDPLRGHVYDISKAGLRIELDTPLEPGESVRLEVELPGASPGVAASARVVWVNDDQDDPGPRRMALRFVEFSDSTNRDRLVRYLAGEHDKRTA